MNINLELYKAFYYVAKNKSISRAADELFVSQPAVSKSIKSLESELNAVLFNRTNAGVTLTYAGEIIYNKIKKAMELISSSIDDLESLNNMECGNINIGAGNTIIQKYLMKYINEFHNMYPNINVKVHTLDTSELIKREQIGLIDIVFTHLPNSFPDNFEVVNLIKLHDILVADKNSKYINKVINKNNLEELPLILLPHGASGRKGFDSFCVSNSINIKPLMEVGNDIIIEECAQSGLGIGLVTKEYVQDKINAGDLVELKTRFNFNDKYLCYAIDSNRKNNIIVENFIKLLK